MQNEVKTRVTGVGVGGTILAMIITPVVFVFWGGIAGAIYAGINFLFAGFAGWWAQIMIGFIQGIAGIAAAKGSCDAVLREYSPKAVFVEFALIALALAAVTLHVYRSTGHVITQFICLAAWLYFAWAAFWKGEALT